MNPLIREVDNRWEGATGAVRRRLKNMVVSPAMTQLMGGLNLLKIPFEEQAWRENSIAHLLIESYKLVLWLPASRGTQTTDLTLDRYRKDWELAGYVFVYLSEGDVKKLATPSSAFLKNLKEGLDYVRQQNKPIRRKKDD